jgi:hypothetical protein
MKKSVSVIGAAFVVLVIVVTISSPIQGQTQIRNASGKITALRVHDVGTGYGPASDSIDVEVVITLNTQPGKAFGFQLRNDTNRVARQGMLDLLRDGFNNDWTVNIDYDIIPGKNNGVIFRVWLTK